MVRLIRSVFGVLAIASVAACAAMGRDIPPTSSTFTTPSSTVVAEEGSSVRYYAFFAAGHNVIQALDQTSDAPSFAMSVGQSTSTIQDFEIDRLHRRLFVLSATQNGSGLMSVIDIPRRREIFSMDLPREGATSHPMKLAVGQRGRYAYYLQATGGLFDPGVISRIDVPHRSVLSSCKTGHNPVGLVADSTRPLVYSSWFYSQNGAIGILNANACRFEKIIPIRVPYYDQTDAVGGYNSGFALSRDGMRLYMASTTGYGLNQGGGYYNKVFVIDTSLKTVIAQPATYGGGGSTAIALSPNGSALVAQDCQFGFTNLIETSTYGDATLLPGDSYALGFNRDGSKLYEADNTRINVLDMASRAITKTLPGFGVTYGDFSE